MPNKIRIILVDDHQAIRESWQFLLDNDERFTVIDQARDGAEAIEKATLHQPDVMLMDINMSPINGFEATRTIMENSPEVRIIGLSANNHPTYATKIIGLGAKGFVTKSSSFEELTGAIVKVFEGGNYVCDEIRNDSNFSLEKL